MSYGGYQSTFGGESSADYSKLTSSIGSKIQEISRNVNSMQKMVNQLGTPSDSETLRQQLRDTQHYTNQLAKDANSQLKDLYHISQISNVSEQKQRKMLREKLTNEFSEALKNFQVIQRTAASKEKEIVIRTRANSVRNQKGPFDDFIGSRNQNLIDLQSPSSEAQQQQPHQQQSQIEYDDEADLEVLREREQDIRKMEGDIVEINQIFKDLASIVHEHGDVIDTIEANIESTAINVESGVEQLQKAARYQQKARCKKLILFSILLGCALVFGLLIYFLSK